MPQSPDDGLVISRAAAKQMIQNFQASPIYADQRIKGGFYGRNKINSLLNQTDCVGIRYYYALSNGKLVITLVGEDKTGECLSDTVVIDEGPLCPPWCPGSNALDA